MNHENLDSNTHQPGHLKLRLARLEAKRRNGNASDRLREMINDNGWRQLDIQSWELVGQTADLLDAYRHVVKALMRGRPALREQLQRFSAADLAAVERDIHG